MFRSPEVDCELSTLSRLPSIIRIIDRFFKSTQARSYTYEQVIQKLSNSLKSTLLSTQKLLDYLLSLELRICPEDLTKRWIYKENYSNQEYIIMNQLDYKMAFLLEQIKSRTDYLTKL